MSSIATIMGLTDYNPYKEAITALVGGVGLCLIDHFTLKPTSIVSKVDRIRETLFGIRARFLELTKKNTLAKYSWVFLKNAPASLALSKAFSLFAYLLTRMLEEAERDDWDLIYVNCVKYLSFLFFLSLFINEDLNPSPPKGKPPNKREEEEQSTSFTSRRSAYFHSLTNRQPSQSNYSNRVWKDYSQPPVTSLGQKSPLTPSNPGGFKFFK